MIMICLGIGCSKHIVINSASRVTVNKEVLIDERFSEEEVREIVNGINDWNWSLNGNIRYNIRESRFSMGMNDLLSDSILIMKVSYKESVGYRPVDGVGYYVPAWSDKLGGRKIYITSDRVTVKDMRGVIVHEMGHIIGIVHKKSGIMVGMYSGYDGCIDKEAVKGLWENVNYCSN